MKTLYYLILLGILSSLYASSADIIALEGKAIVARDSQEMPAKLGMELQKKDTLQTMLRSRAKMKFSDNTIISVGENTRFSIDEYLDDSEPAAEFSITKGFFKSVTGTIGKIAPNKFKIKTSNATIGIRGTEFVGEINENNSTVACTQGSIIVNSSNKNATVAMGQMAIVTFGDINVTTTPVETLNRLEKASGWYPIWQQKEIEKYYQNTKSTKKKPQSENQTFNDIDDIDNAIQDEVEKERSSETLMDSLNIPTPPELPGDGDDEITPPDFPML